MTVLPDGSRTGLSEPSRTAVWPLSSASSNRPETGSPPSRRSIAGWPASVSAGPIALPVIAAALSWP